MPVWGWVLLALMGLGGAAFLVLMVALPAFLGPPEAARSAATKGRDPFAMARMAARANPYVDFHEDGSGGATMTMRDPATGEEVTLELDAEAMDGMGDMIAGLESGSFPAGLPPGFPGGAMSPPSGRPRARGRPGPGAGMDPLGYGIPPEVLEQMAGAGAGAPMPMPTSPFGGSVSVRTGRGGSATSMRVGAAAAKDFPSWAGPYPGARTTSGFAGAEGSVRNGHLSQTTRDPVADVLAHYEDELTRRGFELEVAEGTADPGATSGMIVASRDRPAATVHVDAHRAGERTAITIRFTAGG